MDAQMLFFLLFYFCKVQTFKNFSNYFENLIVDSGVVILNFGLLFSNTKVFLFREFGSLRHVRVYQKLK
jgi:hypothetical protein